MRRWVFLPVLVLTMPFLVLVKGGDALSVCFNTVAILFLCDIDNILFNMALNDATKVEIQRGLRAGKLGQIDDAESSA